MDRDMETITISKFKATCLAVLERVRRTGKPILVTRRGKPIAEVMPPSPANVGADWLGSFAEGASIEGDIVDPVAGSNRWKVLEG